MQAVSDRRVPAANGVYLGGNLLDDHPLGLQTTETASLNPTHWDPFGTQSLSAQRVGPLTTSGGAVDCRSCHDAHDTWRVTGQGRNQTITCLKCHDQAYDSGPHGLASCGSCHRLHEAKDKNDLLREANSDTLCGACHAGAMTPSNPGIDPVPGRPLHAQPSDPACADCHQIHDSGLVPGGRVEGSPCATRSCREIPLVDP